MSTKDNQFVMVFPFFYDKELLTKIENGDISVSIKTEEIKN